MEGKLTYTKGDGYHFERNGKEYVLLEGKAIGCNATSDICFAVELDKECGYKRVYNWFMLGLDTTPEGLYDSCDDWITDDPGVEERMELLEKGNYELSKENYKLRHEIDTLKELLNILGVKEEG